MRVAEMQAAEYLKANAQLRDALGIDEDVELEPHYLGQGEHNYNYWFEDPRQKRKFVLRINVVPQAFHKNQVRYEYAALKALSGSGRAPLPLYIDDSRELLDKDCLVISFCEGQQLDFDALRPNDLKRAMQIMADVHAVKPADDCGLFRPVDPLRNLFDECVTRYGVYRESGFEDERLTRWIEKFMVAAAAQLDLTVPEELGHIINTETLPSHFLIPEDATAEAPGSFIDWERPVIGEVAQDVAYFVSPTTTFWDSEYVMPTSRAYELLEDYWRAVDGRFARGDFDSRFRAWRMMTALRSTTWCCKTHVLLQADPTTYISEKSARKLPVYLSDDFMDLQAKECFGL